MSEHLCETFRAISFRTYDMLGRSRRISHQLLEDSITDINILELKERNPREIFCRTYNRREEGENGADWEWWITNSTVTYWLALRVQAKVLDLSSNRFEHLHYKTQKGKIYQSERLKNECKRNGFFPLYCLYTHGHTPSNTDAARLGGAVPSAEAFGCSLISLANIERLKESNNRRDLKTVMSNAVPWHFLVCCKDGDGVDLPTRMLKTLQHTFEVEIPTPKGRRNMNNAMLSKLKDEPLGLKKDAPDYVKAILSGTRSDMIPKKASRVLVIKESSAD